MATSKIVTASITDDAVTSGKIASGVVPVLRPNVNPLIINGDMAVAQRATSKTGVTDGNFGIWTVDRINFTESGTMSAVIDITQESLTSGNAYTNGFSKAYKIDVTTADTSLAANDYARTNYRIEGQDLQLFKKGTANAEPFTLAFWVKATKTGTNIVQLNDNDNGRQCCASYTISTTNTWEKKVLNFPADTTGVWGNDNAESLRINFILMSGSNRTSGTLQTTWATDVAANTAVGQVNNFDSTSNNVHITGVQLEVGEYTASTIPPFQHETYGENLSRCHRYFEHRGYTAANQQVFTGQTISTTKMTGPTFYAVKRAAPTITMGAAMCTNQHNGVAGNVTTKSTAQIGLDTARFDVTQDASTANFAITQGMSIVQLDNTTIDGLKFDSEL